MQQEGVFYTPPVGPTGGVGCSVIDGPAAFHLPAGWNGDGSGSGLHIMLMSYIVIFLFSLFHVLIIFFLMLEKMENFVIMPLSLKHDLPSLTCCCFLL